MGQKMIRLDPAMLRSMYEDERLSVAKIAERLGLSISTVTRELRTAGVKPVGPRPILLDPNELRRMHIDEQLSVLAMSRQLNVARAIVAREMDRAGIPRRLRSDANRIRMAREGEVGRRRLTEACHAAARGRVVTLSERTAYAAARANAPVLSPLEAVFASAFDRAGLRPVPQFALGKWNFDFAFTEQRVAVEIDPGHWHSVPSKARTDAKKDADAVRAGWTVIRWSGNQIRQSNPQLSSVADDLVSSLIDNGTIRLSA